MTKRYPALLNGSLVTARKSGRAWMVGGDYVQPGQSIQIMTMKGVRPAWYSLRGAVLRFSDYASPREAQEGFAAVACAHEQAGERVPTRVAAIAAQQIN